MVLSYDSGIRPASSHNPVLEPGRALLAASYMLDVLHLCQPCWPCLPPSLPCYRCLVLSQSGRHGKQVTGRGAVITINVRVLWRFRRNPGLKFVSSNLLMSW